MSCDPEYCIGLRFWPTPHILNSLVPEAGLNMYYWEKLNVQRLMFSVEGKHEASCAGSVARAHYGVVACF